MRLIDVAPLAALGLGACSGPLAGTWIGDLECAGVPYEFQLTLEQDKGKVYTGSGEQTREFTSTAGQTTNVKIAFDVTLELSKGKGAQDLTTELVCTYEDVVIFRPGGGDPETVEEGCTPRRFEDWTIGWDGEDGLTIADPEGCSGDLIRRGE